MENILVIEMGADSIKLAEFSYPATDQIVLEQFQINEYGGDYTDEQLVDALSANLNTLLLNVQATAKRVYVCVSGQLIFMKFVKLPPISDTERLREVAEFEAKQNMPFPVDEVEYHVEILPSGEASEPEAMFVVIKKSVIERLSNVIEHCGFKVGLVDVAPTSGYNAARLNGLGQDNCTMLLNIGGRTSTLTFIEGDRFFVRTIPIAGRYITEQIQREFGISYKEAEDMKKSIGFVALGGAYEEPSSEAAATVSKIARNAMTRLHGEINRSINVYRATQGGNKPELMYLSGGGSIMQYTPFFFNEKMRIPVEYFNAFNVVSLGEEVNKEHLEECAHLLSEVIGTGVRAVTVCAMNVNLLPATLLKKNEVKQQMPYLYGAIAAMLLCSVIFFFGSLTQANYYEKHCARYKTTIDEKNEISESLSTKKKDLEVLEKKVTDLIKTQKNRMGWIEIFSEIQEILPANSWVVEVKPVSGANKEEPTRSGRPSRHTQAVAKTVDAVDWIELSIYTLCQGSQTGDNTQMKIQSRIKTNPKSIFKGVEFGKNTLATDVLNLASCQIKLQLKTPIIQKQN